MSPAWLRLQSKLKVDPRSPYRIDPDLSLRLFPDGCPDAQNYEGGALASYSSAIVVGVPR